MTPKKKTVKKSGKRSAKRTAKRSAKRPKAARAQPRAITTDYQSAVLVASDSRKATKARVVALANLTSELCNDGAVFRSVLEILKDRSAPVKVRLTALQVLQAASFSAIKFNAFRPEYLAALRSVATDPDPEIRQRTLGILAREQDGRAQQLLLEGLKNPSKALVAPEKALQLLSYDIHSDAYPIAREIVQNPPNKAAKREALRMLAADATSAPVFEKILADKKEALDVRQISAAALQALAPDRLQQQARRIALDDSESEGLRTTSLTALTQFGQKEQVGSDDALVKHVAGLKGSKSSASLKRGAQDFLKKFAE
jgi:hypothetical protein